MKWLLLVALLVPSLAGATTYYVSEVATNGYVVGNDGNAGTAKGTAKLTISNAITTATQGDTIYVNDGTYTDTELGASGYVDIAAGKGMSIYPETEYGATIAAHTATLLWRIRNDTTTAVTIGKFILDCEKITTAPGTYIATGIQSDATTVQTSVTLAGTRIQNCSTQNYVDNATLGTLTFTDVIFAGRMKDGLQGSLSMAGTGAKAYVINGLTLSNVESTDTAAATVVSATRLSTSANEFSLYVAGITGTITAPSALGASATVTVVNATGITTATNPQSIVAPPIIEDLSVTLVGYSTTTSCYGVRVVNNAAGATATADNTIVRDNAITMNCPAGYAVLIGDSTTAYDAANARVYGNTAVGSFYNGVATPHGIVCGRVSNCQAYSNSVAGFAVGVMCSVSTTCAAYGNKIVGAYYAPLFAKGNTSATIAHNTVVIDDALYGAKFGNYGCIGVAVQGATNNAATTFQNNLCYVASGTGWKHVVVDASQVATFDANNYYSVPTLTTPWSYQATTYATVALWNAAATVGTETAVDPLFMGASDYLLQGASTLLYAGVPGVPCLDYRGRACYLLNPNIGAYQSTSGDPAATRAVRN